jgi:hypothetical protein
MGGGRGYIGRRAAGAARSRRNPVWPSLPRRPGRPRRRGRESGGRGGRAVGPNVVPVARTGQVVAVVGRCRGVPVCGHERLLTVASRSSSGGGCPALMMTP